MVQFSLVCKQESDYFQNALQENNSNNTNTAEVEHLKQTIAAMRHDMNILKNENSSLKIDKENLAKERKNDARRIKRLETENKSLESKAKAVKIRHEKVYYCLKFNGTGSIFYFKRSKRLNHFASVN